MANSSNSGAPRSLTRGPIDEQPIAANTDPSISSPTTILFDLNHSPSEDVEDGEILDTNCDLSLSLAPQVIQEHASEQSEHTQTPTCNKPQPRPIPIPKPQPRPHPHPHPKPSSCSQGPLFQLPSSQGPPCQLQITSSNPPLPPLHGPQSISSIHAGLREEPSTALVRDKGKASVGSVLGQQPGLLSQSSRTSSDPDMIGSKRSTGPATDRMAKKRKLQGDLPVISDVGRLRSLGSEAVIRRQ